ncbi:MAG: hypothetical protein K8F60_11130 [Melioribacteraceae bacterium]|nr:hypothetical protein [Melioribacteraceae bacterium]
MFIDKKGVNAKSELFENINILNRYKIDDAYYQKWLSNYLEFKKNQKTIPQQFQRQKYLNKLFILDLISLTVLNIPTNSNYNLFIKLKNYFNKINIRIESEKVNLQNEKYLFHALQVNCDSQVVMNSNITNLDAIKLSNKIALSKGVLHLVKFHPAETDPYFIQSVFALKKELQFKVVNDNSFELIKNAEIVTTINSTIALEAKILGKKVELFGRSFYNSLTKANIPKYILGHLINIDFFSTNVIDYEIYKDIKSRIN